MSHNSSPEPRRHRTPSSDTDIINQSRVHRAVVADLQSPAGPVIPVHTRFSYYRSDPWAVTFSFRTGAHGFVDWTMGRQLLADGLLTDVGAGDVRIGPVPGEHRTSMCVESPSGKALFHFDSDELHELLALTTALVPWGHEHDHVDLDTEIRALLAATGGEA